MFVGFWVYERQRRRLGRILSVGSFSRASTVALASSPHLRSAFEQHLRVNHSFHLEHIAIRVLDEKRLLFELITHKTAIRRIEYST